MKKREPVSHIMTSNVITVNVANSLQEAEATLKSNNIRHIPVVSGEKLVGMLSLTDLLRISFVDNFGEGEGNVDTTVYNMLSIDQVMVGNPKCVSSTDSIRKVAEILSEREFHALPVVDDGKLVGIVTSTDLIKYLLEQY